jgi:hypothetical protein
MLFRSNIHSHHIDKYGNTKALCLDEDLEADPEGDH